MSLYYVQVFVLYLFSAMVLGVLLPLGALANVLLARRKLPRWARSYIDPARSLEGQRLHHRAALFLFAAALGGSLAALGFGNMVLHDLAPECQTGWVWLTSVDPRFCTVEGSFSVEDMFEDISRGTFNMFAPIVLSLIACAVLSPWAPAWLSPAGYLAAVAICLKAPVFVFLVVARVGLGSAWGLWTLPQAGAFCVCSGLAVLAVWRAARGLRGAKLVLVVPAASAAGMAAWGFARGLGPALFDGALFSSSTLNTVGMLVHAAGMAGYVWSIKLAGPASSRRE